jgi:hypothetical protein
MFLKAGCLKQEGSGESGLMTLKAGLPDFTWYVIPKLEKMYQTNEKCTKWP